MESNLRSMLRQKAEEAARARAEAEARTAAELIIEIEAAITRAAEEGEVSFEMQCPYPEGVRTLIARWAANPANDVECRYQAGRMVFKW